MAGVMAPPEPHRLACGGPTLETVPSSSLPGGHVTVRRASARPRRVRPARRSRHVAWSRSLSAVLLTPSPGERRLSGSTRPGVPSTRRRSTATTGRGASRFTTWAMKTCRHGRRRGRPWAPLRSGSRHVSRLPRTEEHPPSGQNTRGRGRAPRRPRSMSRRISGRSRGGLTAPASPRRVLSISAQALPTRPPCVLTPIASACTCPRARGGSPRGACTAGPWTPARASHPAPVRASWPNATTRACRAHP
jgi:hypothetical protein